MSNENKLLYRVGTIISPAEGAKQLLTSVVLQAKLDVFDLSRTKEERHEAKEYIEDVGNGIVKHFLGREYPLDTLIIC